MKHQCANSRRLVLPSTGVMSEVAGENSYALRNYYGKGPIAVGKRRRFLKALRLGAQVPADCVIDMGTADGVFLPTLSSHYRRVVAVDSSLQFVNQAARLADAMKLNNVELICNRDLSFDALAEKIGPGFGLMYLLETLEHVGSQPDVWNSKADFLHQCFNLLDDRGGVVISVPKMVGPEMLFKTSVQRILGMPTEKMSWRELIKSSLMYNTDDLEPRWSGSHLGFNHRKLESITFRRFHVEKRAESLISVFYLLRR